MKYSFQQKLHIDALNSQGLSSRQIAAFLGISKSGVNNYLKNKQEIQAEEVYEEQQEQKRILMFDLEVAADTVLTFGRWDQNISQSAVVKQGGYILCAAWKFLDDAEVQSICLTPSEISKGNDSRIVKKLIELYSESYAVCAHNNLKYDHKVLQTRCSFNNLPPLPKVKVIDTLPLVKRHLKLPSNKLADVAAYFGLSRKSDSGGMESWKLVQSGDALAMSEMVDYCKQDVVVLSEIYKKLRNIGNAGVLLYSGKGVCPFCESTHFSLTGREFKTGTINKEEVVCKSCKGRYLVNQRK